MSEQTTPEHGAPEQGTPSKPTTADEHGFGVDEDNHGWAPDVQSSGKTTGAGHKAWEANDTQDAAHGDGDSSPDPGDPRLPAENAGQSTAARGEDIMDRDGKEAGRQDTGTQGASERPTGTSTARDVTGVNPQDPIDPESPNQG
jgi:hypothetical protein